MAIHNCTLLLDALPYVALNLESKLLVQDTIARPVISRPAAPSINLFIDFMIVLFSVVSYGLENQHSLVI